MKYRRLHQSLARAVAAFAIAVAPSIAICADSGTSAPGSATGMGGPASTGASQAGTSGGAGGASSTPPASGPLNHPASPDNAETKPTAGPGSTSPGSATPAPGDTARRIFEQLDTNHDGVLSFEEFSKATIRRQ